MNIIKGSDLITSTEDYDVILVGTGTYCSLANGFQSKIRYKYPFVEVANDRTPFADTRKLGTRLTVQEGDSPIISLLYIYEHIRHNDSLHYDALEKCLLTANAEFAGKKVATTVLGATRFDGNGDKERILDIMEKSTPYIDLDVYDYEQMDKEEEKNLIIRKIYSLKRKDYTQFENMWNVRFDIFRRMGLIL